MFESIGEGHKIMHEGQRPEPDLDELLERLAKAATPGPWHVTCDCTGKMFYSIKSSGLYLGEIMAVYNGDANAAYIVAACNAVPELIARVRELEREVEEWKESSEEYAIQFHALHDEFIENNPNSFTNRFLRSETAKETGE